MAFLHRLPAKRTAPPPLAALAGAWLACLAGAAQAEDAAPASSAPERNYELQLGVYITAPWNLEDPFLNLAKSMNTNWRAFDGNGLVLDAAAARKGGYINAAGLPRRLPDNATRFLGPGFLSGVRAYPDYYVDHYTLEWDGDAYGFINGHPRDLQTRSGRNRLKFFVPYGDELHRSLGFSMIRGDGVKGVRIFRNEYRERIEAGEIWSPDFLDYVKRYDIIRTMDMQATNASPVRSFDDVARPDDATYGGRFKVEWAPSPRYGAPFEVLFDLAVTADAKLWLNLPPMIGAPMHPAHPSLRGGDKKNWVDGEKLAAMAREHASAILASDEWTTFAREFVDRLVASDYPAGRLLYLELGNEIWNTALPFSIHTYYATGIGQSANKKWGVRQGYGVLSARWAAALEAELAARELDYSIVYVLASHTAWPARTGQAIEGFKYQLAREDVDAQSILKKTGVALTTYVHCSKAYAKNVLGASEGDDLRRAWEAAIDADPEGLKKRLHDYCVDGPASEGATRAWILKNWRAHRQIAERHGLSILGAYEGGSHDNPGELLSQSDTFRAWWREYHWGPHGADVVRQVNLAIAKEFPGVILSNYAGIGGVGGAPWFDGHYAEETDMLHMWDEFAKPQ